MIRLLLDQGLPRSTVRHLEERGIDICHVADIGHSRASDPKIIELAREQGRVIVTLDSGHAVTCRNRAGTNPVMVPANGSLMSVFLIRAPGLPVSSGV